MNNDVRSVAELRVLVGYLGEQAPAWWSSRFFGPQAAAFQPSARKHNEISRQKGLPFLLLDKQATPF